MIHGVYGLLFNKIVKIIEITENISIIHITIANLIKKYLDDFEYHYELVILP
jgi:hypothetical protein